MDLKKARALLITAPLIMGSTVLMGSVSLLVSLFDSGGRSQHRVARAWSRMLLRISGVKVYVEGLEKIAPAGSYVFAANHRSFMDIPVILPNIPVQFRFMANKNLFRIPFLGYHLHRAGHLPVNSSNSRESLKSMSEAAQTLDKRGISILIFPEGRRTEGELAPFKDGAAHIAIKAGVPLVPVSVSGTREVLPMGSPFVHGGEVRIRIGDPISTVDYMLQDRAGLTRRLYEAVAELHEDRVPVA